MKRVEEIWGTAVGVDIGDDVGPAVVEEVFAWFARVDELFSTWRDDSQIVRIARGELGVEMASPEVRTVIERCRELSLETDGAFDIAATGLLSLPHPPGWCPLDPSAMVKGWAVDRAADLLHGAGATRFCVNAGGDVLVGGGPTSEQAWRVGIVHPWRPDHLAGVVTVTDAAVATSGRYERGSHIVDPRTGRPAVGLASVTVVAADLATADAYSTAVFALGEDGLEWLRCHPHVDAMAITDEAQVFTTAGFDELRLAPGP